MSPESQWKGPIEANHAMALIPTDTRRDFHVIRSLSDALLARTALGFRHSREVFHHVYQSESDKRYAGANLGIRGRKMSTIATSQLTIQTQPVANKSIDIAKSAPTWSSPLSTLSIAFSACRPPSSTHRQTTAAPDPRLYHIAYRLLSRLSSERQSGLGQDPGQHGTAGVYLQ
ncbi:uncharacterized protein SETTUDRAFT_34164 [Exserohilum turcica Et28A]|uniref:Uncharacterized protein n=1 Tax=Exserohilum turcicum (strain 28A) TaxID=671987 RepID=R0IBJ1_EXST2|nr:uncharacterized protein SETTUDRAFT_34164 [Exserohilum turcica Et28A]EOA82611.1 hypothetical protein SETTUDRAFT_34164 [Exserohilum turcica Et28A]